MAIESNSASDWIILMKFGMNSHLEEFRNGLIYARHISEFSKSSAGDARVDRYEGAEWMYQPDEIRKLTISRKKPDKDIVLGSKNFAGPLVYSTGKKANCNIYCMYSIGNPPPEPLVDERNQTFGDSFVIVIDTQAFLDRVATAVRKIQFACDCGRIDYYDDSRYSGETGPFKKPSRFAHQQEFRIAFYPGVDGPLRLEVGSLADITTPVQSLADINKDVELCVA
jgi:hypothetical protein